jgi:hypothetical protein
VQSISHYSAVPSSKAVLSSKSKSTPSRVYLSTKSAIALQVVFGSSFAVAGNSVAPKALTNNFLPYLWYLERIFFLISSSVYPKGLSVEKKCKGYSQIKAVSADPVLNQKVNKNTL